MRSISSASTFVVADNRCSSRRNSSPAARSSALCSGKEDAIEIVATDEKVARETAAIVERIARAFGQLKRGALSLRHFGRVDDGSGCFAGLALVSSRTCFSGASSGDFIRECGVEVLFNLRG